MKTLILSTVALMLIAVSYLNAELAFCLLTSASVIGIAATDYASHRLVTGIEA